MSISGMILINPNEDTKIYTAQTANTVFMTLVNTSNAPIQFTLIKDNIVNTIVEEKMIGGGQVNNAPITLYIGGSLSIKTQQAGLKVQIKIPELISSVDSLELSSKGQEVTITLKDYDKLIRALIYSESGRLVFDSKYLILQTNEDTVLRVDRISRGDDVIVITLADINLVKRINVKQVDDPGVVVKEDVDMVALYYTLKQKKKEEIEG